MSEAKDDQTATQCVLRQFPFDFKNIKRPLNKDHKTNWLLWRKISYIACYVAKCAAKSCQWAISEEWETKMQVWTAMLNVPSIDDSKSLFMNISNARAMLENVSTSEKHAIVEVNSNETTGERKRKFADLDYKVNEKKTVFELMNSEKKNTDNTIDIAQYYTRIIRTILKKKEDKIKQLLKENLNRTLTYQFKDNGWSSSSIDNDKMEELKTLYDTKSTNMKVTLTANGYRYVCFCNATDGRFYQKNLNTDNIREFRLIDTKGSTSLTDAQVREVLELPINMIPDIFLNEEEQEEVLNNITTKNQDVVSEDIARLGTLYSAYSLKKKYDPQSSQIWARREVFLRWLKKCIHEKIEEFIIGFHGSNHYNEIKLHPDLWTLQHMNRNGTAHGPGLYVSFGSDTVPNEYSIGCSQSSSYNDGSVIMCLLPTNLNTEQVFSYHLGTNHKPGPMDYSNHNVGVLREPCMALPFGICAL